MKMKLSSIIVFLFIQIICLKAEDEDDHYKYWIGEDWFFVRHDSILQNVFHGDKRATGMQFSQQILFKDSLNGLLTCSDGGTGAWIFRTTNGGILWEEILYEIREWEWGDTINAPGTITKSEINENQVIIAACYYPFFGINNPGYILRSTNFGDSFEKIIPEANNGFFDISMLNAKYGTLLATSEVLITNDSGKTWNRSKPFPDSIKQTRYIQVVDYGKIFRTDVWWQEPGSGLHRIYFSSDNGNTWENRSTDDFHIYSTHFFNSNDGILIGYDSLNLEYQNRLYAKITNNGGKSWNLVWDTVMYIDRYSIRYLKFKNRNTGIMGGDWGDLFQTTDGGLSWTFIGANGKTPPIDKLGFPFKNFDFVGSSKIIAIGILWASEEIIHIPLKTPVNVIDNQTELKIDVYPNPTKDKLKFEIPVTANKVEIIDLLGQERISLSNLFFLDEINISILEPGVYFVNIYTTEGIITKKILKQ